MKAFILHNIGSFDNLKIKTLAIPKPGKNEVTVKVDFCGLNHLDLLIIAGKRPVSGKFPLILGSEFTGKIADPGKSQKFAIGDTVAVYPWTFCGKCPQCRSDRESICDRGGTYGRTKNGGLAEFAAVDEKNLVRIPHKLDSGKFCASVLSAITAKHMLDRIGIKNGSTVLVNGATGGVGTAAIQLLKRKKCQVICSTSKPEKEIKLKHLGADLTVNTKHMVNSLKEKFPEGIEYIVDAIGGKIWSESVQLLTKNGNMVFCATTLEENGQINIGQAFTRQINLMGSYGGYLSDLREIIKFVRTGAFNPIIDSVYPLDNTKEALLKLLNQKVFGKILIKVNGSY